MDYEIVRWRYTYDDKDPLNSEENRHKSASRLVDNIAICSCYMCRNVRRSPYTKNYDRLTLPEKKALDRYEYDLEEVDIVDDIEDNDIS